MNFCGGLMLLVSVGRSLLLLKMLLKLRIVMRARCC